jgi:hypothetical protein
MKGLSVITLFLILLIMLVLLLIPAFIVLQSTPVFSYQGKLTGYPSNQIQSSQVNQVYRGNPNIYYNSSTNPYLSFSFQSVPYTFNVTQIYYFNGSVWVPVLTKPIAVSGNLNLPLPPKAFNRPVIVVTGTANIFFLNPNTSITTVAISGPAGKVPLYITAFVLNGSKVLPMTLSVTFQGTQNYLTPVILYVNPGTYSIAINNGTTVFLPQYGLTATFKGWSVVGYGSASSYNTPVTSVTVTGPTVLTAIYNASLQKFPVTIVPSGIPLGTSINGAYGSTLTSLNTTIPIYVDNKLYYVGSNGITLNLTYGYHIIQAPQYYNITFDFKKGYFYMPAGQINTYNFTSLSSSTNKIQVVNTYTIFVNGTGTVYVVYNSIQTYYKLVVTNNFTLPKGDQLISNSSPVLGNIAGQLLRVNNNNNGQSYVLGPAKDYVPQQVYFPANTRLVVTLGYMNQMGPGTYVINVQGKQYTFYYLLGASTSYVYISAPPSVSNYASNNPITVYASRGNYGWINVVSPLYITFSQRWAYGGVSS